MYGLVFWLTDNLLSDHCYGTLSELCDRAPILVFCYDASSHHALTRVSGGVREFISGGATVSKQVLVTIFVRLAARAIVGWKMLARRKGGKLMASNMLQSIETLSVEPGTLRCCSMHAVVHAHLNLLKTSEGRGL